MSDRMTSEAWRGGLTDEVEARLGVLWGKSNTNERGSDEAPRMNLLIQHLFDAMAVGELMWDHYLAPVVQDDLDEITGGAGRRFLAWLCALHDIGKASPAFQSYDPGLARAVQASGLRWKPISRRQRQQARHEAMSAAIFSVRVRDAWADGRAHARWMWPLLAGHHGVVRGAGAVLKPPTALIGARDPEWVAVQSALVDLTAVAAGYRDLSVAEPAASLDRSHQLALSGFVVMADWIASDGTHFPGISNLDEVSVEASRVRGRQAWSRLGLRGGWGRLLEPSDSDFQKRFGFEARESQKALIAQARVLEAPGLLICEAPMGEGKTNAALFAAEVLAARFGADGIFVGMPTQATADPMFTQVLEWSAQLGDDLPVALLHGKRRFNDKWERLVSFSSEDGGVPGGPGAQREPHVDPYGMADEPPSLLDPGFSCVAEDCPDCDEIDRLAPSEWFLAGLRGLLTPLAVGTIDHLLFAATRTKHVMLRFAGLVGKVVVIDEVHAADTYMAQFLGEALFWLGRAKVPVVLLSATLAPRQRQDLVDAYLRGAAGGPHEDHQVPDDAHYPRATVARVVGGEARIDSSGASPGRRSSSVAVEVSPEGSDHDSERFVKLLGDRLLEGGCALVVRNTVDRAQESYRAIADALGSDDVVILHGRLTVGARADRTSRLLDQLGSDRSKRPQRLIVVATQVAEQSFDIDADLLVSDLAPIDLLIQRAGRVHRHSQDPAYRPPQLRRPTVVVAGTGGLSSDAVPALDGGSEAIYGRHRLLRTAAAVMRARDAGGWTFPADIPSLVDEVYGPDDMVPSSWREAATQAEEEWHAAQRDRASKADEFRLSTHGQLTAKTLDGLNNEQRIGQATDGVRVRDGEPSEEVVLIRRVGDRYRSWDGAVDLGEIGELGREHPKAVLAGAVKLPTSRRYHGLASKLRPLPDWHDDPWLRHSRVVVLDGQMSALVDAGTQSWRLTYDLDAGLQVTRI